MTINRKKKKTSLIYFLINFGCWNVSTYINNNAAHTSQCMKTASVQHTIAPTQPDRQSVHAMHSQRNRP